MRGYWAEVWVRWAVYSISAGIHNDNATRWTYIRREFFRTLNAALFREGWMVARMAFVYRMVSAKLILRVSAFRRQSENG